MLVLPAAIDEWFYVTAPGLGRMRLKIQPNDHPAADPNRPLRLVFDDPDRLFLIDRESRLRMRGEDV